MEIQIKHGKILLNEYHLLLIFITNLQVQQKKIKRRSKYLHIVLEVKAVFRPTPRVSFRIARKIRHCPVTANLYPLEWKSGSGKCIKTRCQVDYNIETTALFSATVTSDTY